MKTKDFNAQFERMKKFKDDHAAATDNDEFFKALYSRLRKYVKKLNKMNETQEKIQKGKEATAEQKGMLSKKKELEASLEEMSYLNAQYMDNFEAHCQQIWALRPEQTVAATEDRKEEVVKEEPKPVEVAEPEPKVDVEAISREGYARGFADGRDAGYGEGKRSGYESGKNDGYSQAKHEIEESFGKQTRSDTDKALNYASVIAVMINWFDTFLPLNPQFRRNDYFTEEEIFAIKSLYMMNSANVSAINFSRTIAANSERVKKLVNRSDDPVLNVHTVTYRQLAESIDRVLESEQFVNTDYQVLANDMMMGMGGYASMPGMMPGQMFGQFPGAMMAQVAPQTVLSSGMNAPTSSSYEHKIADAPVKHHEPTHKPVEQTATIVHVEFDEPAHETGFVNQSATDAHETKLKQDQVWNDDDDEDEDDQADSEHEDPESDGEVAKEQAPTTQGAPVEPHTDGQEVKDEKFYENRPYNKRGGRGFNRGYQQRGGYRGQQTQGYRGQQTQQYRGYNNRGGYNQEHQGRYRNARRGGRRGGNNPYAEHYHTGQYQEHAYHEYGQEETKKGDEPKTKVDEDDFFVVKEKSFVKKKRGGRKPRETPQTES